MATDSPRVKLNVGAQGVHKMAALRLSDIERPSTSDYAEILVGDGAPSGAYGRASGTTMFYIRKDASTVATALYVTVNGGTNWTALDPADLTGQDLNGTELILDADGDTSITADTDDQIDFRLSGADDFQMTANLFSVLTGSSVALADSAGVKFGTGLDIVFAWDGTDLAVTQAAADSIVKWGVSGAGINHVFYGDTATRDMTWDQSNDQLLFNDNTKLAIGSGAGAAGDICFSWDATRLNVTQLTANSEIRWGVDGAGIDQMWYGDTASAYLQWDQSADKLILGGVAKLQFQTIAAATGTAIPVTHSGSFPITQNGAETNTLADPTYLGQWISIFVDTDTSGARVITAASRINQTGNTIITLTEVGDFIKLEAITIGGSLKWQVVANDGAVLS